MSKLGRILGAFALVAGLSTQAQAVIIDNATPIPDDVILLNFNNSGLDWVYAGPIAPEEFAIDNIYSPSYRAAEGWRTATAQEWASHPIWTDFIIGGNVVAANAGHTDHSTYLFASEYWGNFNHVDINDFAAGKVTDGVNGNLLVQVPETIYVRDTRGQVDNGTDIPEPASLALLGLGLAGLGIARRKA